MGNYHYNDTLSSRKPYTYYRPVVYARYSFELLLVRVSNLCGSETARSCIDYRHKILSYVCGHQWTVHFVLVKNGIYRIFSDKRVVLKQNCGMNVQVKLNRKQLNKPRNTNEIKKKKKLNCVSC